MQWERRRPLWPLIGGLACLFGLAVAAPYCWQHPVLNVHELIERRQIVRPIEKQPLPVRTTFNLDTLRFMHATLKRIVDVTESVAPQTLPQPKPLVIVSSENDRLAMLDTRKSKPSLPLIEPTITIQQPATVQQELLAVVPTPLLRQPPLLLIDRLEKLAHQPLATEWATAVLTRLKQLTETPATPPAIGLQILSELEQLATAGQIRSLEISDPAVQQNWLQAAQGLQRRLGIWELLIERGGAEPITPTVEQVGDLLPVLNATVTLLSGTANGEEWREYLLVDQIAAAASEGVAFDQATRMRLSQEVLSRLSDGRLTAEQRTFIATEPLASLTRELRPWAAGPVDLRKLLALVERYEADSQMLYAAAIGQLAQRMMWSNDAELQALALDLQQQFRGANMRIALSHDMFNRMIPPQPAIMAPVHERIAGTKVNGSSRTTSDVAIHLLPADDAWRIGLRAEGNVMSKTRSDTWPVKVRNDALYKYEAEKVITIDGNGLDVAPTQAYAKGRHKYLGSESEFDRVPFMGAMFRGLAKKANMKSRPQAMVQVRSKVAQKARTRMDSEADPKLLRLEKRFEDYVMMPFGQLALAAEPLEMFTTADRAVMEMRLANLDQLAAHTPRPSAPADSVVSMQLHETALNNAFAGLDLEGRRMTLPELHKFLTEKFGQAEAPLPANFPHRARIEFAKHDAVHVSFVEDRLELVLNIRELGQGRDKIKNFQVHAYYRPHLDGLAVMLVRDETLQFSSSQHLKTGARIVLHSVMGKVFSKGRELRMVRKTLESDPRFGGLMVTQLVIDDGWMALALGPTTTDRTAWRTPNYSLEAELVK
ncbi:MAG: hypothetical protein SH868_11485 [Bythopirellula sp.]|nr:hypothetical protein [Bythopirellula sp.]